MLLEKLSNEKYRLFPFQESASPNELIHGESKAIYSLDVNESPKITFQVIYIITLRHSLSRNYE